MELSQINSINIETYPPGDTVTIAVDPVKIATEKPEVPKLSRKEIGRLFYTITHGTVVACQHKAKFSATKQPSTNCVDCWTAFFMTAVDLDAVHKLLTEKGVKALVAKFGTKFVRAFHGFLAMSLMPKGIQGETQEELQEII